MKLYSYLSKVRFLNRYSYKFLFIAFLGIHIPLLGLISFIVLSPEPKFSAGSIIAFALLFTLLATGLTLYILHNLIRPIRLAQQALTTYIASKKVPELPVHYTDEVGVLLHDIQFTVKEFNSLLQEKKDLISMLSHDLRSPVITMLDAISLLREEIDPETMQLYLDEMEKMGQKQLDLVHSVLKLLKYESGNFNKNDLKPVKVNPLLHEIADQFELPLKKKKLTLHFVLNQAEVLAEPAVFSQVLSNVLVNAIKFTHKGGDIFIESFSDENKTTIQVRDNGLGFDPDAAEALFKKFTEHRKKGTSGEATNGLGLYLCRQMMHKQDGRIYAFSAGKNLGSTFTIEIPNATPPKPEIVAPTQLAAALV